MRVALITGLSGQDGSYLAEFLQSREYAVHGFEGDLRDASQVRQAVASVRPHECYHLGAQTFVHGEELSTLHVNTNGTMHVLEALRHEAPQCRLFFAGSAEMFGDPAVSPQTEDTLFRPRNVYGASKVAAWHLMDVYRRQYGMFAACGILYNHESPRRGPQFVTRKITRAAARIRAGLDSELLLGNLDAVRDWGHAADYVRAMWLMLQASSPADYIIASGTGRSVRHFVEAAFKAAGLHAEPYVRSVPEFWRPTEAVPLIGDASRLKQQLGWAPAIGFEDMIAEMVQADIAALG